MDSAKIKALLRDSFCVAIEQSLGESPKECVQKLSQGYISSLAFSCEGDKYTLYIVSMLPFLQHISSVMLFDDEPSEEVLQDICKELANLVAGVAKVSANKNSVAFGIATPLFVGSGNFRAPFNDYCYFAFGQNPCCSLYWIRH
ncbi:MAG: chemotaxis protein CheX [Helicobacter sp.]|nr:chemotaxis protein CheX [Helicobacter sp.]